MGSGQSVRATHFNRPETSAADPMEEDVEEHHISISNKMVERLVEDATLISSVPSTAPSSRAEYKDKIYMEKLKCMDDSHSERCGLTVEGLNALAARIDRRTSMASVEPVCEECKERVIQCYANNALPADAAECWEAVGEFSQCVQEVGASRLRARSERETRDAERRSRHVALAREHALKDLSPQLEATAV